VTRLRARPASLCAALLLALGVPPAHAADAASTDVLDRVAPAVVAVDAVFQMRVSYQGQVVREQEVPAPGLGVVVDPSGLVVVGDVGHLTKAFERGMPGLSISLAPRTLKVTFAGESKEHDAVLVVRDSGVGVAFLQILDLGDRKVPFVDLQKPGEGPRLGQDLLAVRRLGRGFDHAAELLRLSVAQAIQQPRRMWGIRGDFQEHGLPAFDRSGAPVGLVTIQFGSEGIDVGSAMTGGGIAARLCLLPLDVVGALVDQARKRVPEAVAKARGDKDAASPGGAAMDGAGMDGAGMDGAGMDGAGMDGALPGGTPPEKDPVPPK
jgi:hypothetical protein